jgi:hypothetical protein
MTGSGGFGVGLRVSVVVTVDGGMTGSGGFRSRKAAGNHPVEPVVRSVENHHSPFPSVFVTV